MRRTIVFTVLIRLPITLATSMILVQHASVSVPADARLDKAPPVSSPAASPTRAPETAINQTGVDAFLWRPNVTLFSPAVTHPGNSSNKTAAPSPTATAWLHACGDGSSGSDNGRARGADTASAGLAAAQAFDEWRASNPSKSFGDYLLRRNRNESNATGITAAARSPKSKVGFNLSDWIMSPAFTDTSVSDSHFAPVTFPPPPAAPRRESKTFGDSFYEYSRGDASAKDDISASFNTYDPVMIASLLLVQSALVVFT